VELLVRHDKGEQLKTRFFLCLAIVMFVGLVSYSATTGWLRRTWNQVVRSEPLIEYLAKIDLGDHELGDEAIGHFTIANRGGGELVVDQIETNCSCSGMEREQDGRYGRLESLRLKAGERADLVMRVSVRGVPDGAEMINVVKFETNDPTQPTGRIEAVVRHVSGGVTASPRTIVFGTVRIGTNLRYIVDVRDNALTPRVIERVTSTKPERVNARLVPPENSSQSPDSVSAGILIGRIEIKVDTNSPGDFDDTVQVHLAGEPRRPDAISIIGKVEAPFEISPSLLVLPRASTSGPIFDAKCICRSTSGEPLSLAVDSVPPGVTADVLEQDHPALKCIRIRWNPDQAEAATARDRQFIRLRAKSGEHGRILEVQLLLNK
jgi:hypothetical protein